MPWGPQGGGSWEVTVGQAERVEGCIARVMPEQLLLQEGNSLQGQDQRLVLQHAMHVQAWGRRVKVGTVRVELHPPGTPFLPLGSNGVGS